MNTHPVAAQASDLTDAAWRASSYSNGGGNCVEIAHLTDTIAIRDSKNPHGPALLLATSQFTALVDIARAGECTN
ncbi:DUF397 domain-containing protein [Streptomyces sp. NPDC048172]|uniref:DUF397 domain-containing protein n=1 Tax=Streptomyces sp. NPDC048172 TaxID=3365505 RepID=UPI00371708AB